MGKRTYAALLHEYLEEMSILTDAEFGRMCRALLRYSKTGEKEEQGGNERFVLPRVFAAEDRAQESYDKRKSAGEKGGKANGSNCKQMEACESNGKQSGQSNFNSNSDSNLPPDGGSEKARAGRFTPPTLAEVQAYVLERHSPVDAQEFLDFYASKGWMVGKTPMKDWKAACRNAEKWERWGRKPVQAAGGNPFLELAEEYGRAGL